jgi:rhodanese-related sulfurtransferase
MSPYEIKPAELKNLLEEKAAIALIDCREPFEHAVARIEPCELIPMNTIPNNINRLEGIAENKQLIVYCHHGVRSLNTVAWLRRQGIENCVSLAGGIDQWSVEIDPTVPRY